MSHERKFFAAAGAGGPYSVTDHSLNAVIGLVLMRSSTYTAFGAFVYVYEDAITNDGYSGEIRKSNLKYILRSIQNLTTLPIITWGSLFNCFVLENKHNDVNTPEMNDLLNHCAFD